jgi:hypothetical protein
MARESSIPAPDRSHDRITQRRRGAEDGFSDGRITQSRRGAEDGFRTAGSHRAAEVQRRDIGRRIPRAVEAWVSSPSAGEQPRPRGKAAPAGAEQPRPRGQAAPVHGGQAAPVRGGHAAPSAGPAAYLPPLSVTITSRSADRPWSSTTRMRCAPDVRGRHGSDPSETRRTPISALPSNQ